MKRWRCLWDQTCPLYGVWQPSRDPKTSLHSHYVRNHQERDQ